MSIEDRAQVHELAEWERINRPREIVEFKPGEPGYGPAYCTSCEDDMPETRRAYGYRVCVVCATEIERCRALGLR